MAGDRVCHLMLLLFNMNTTQFCLFVLNGAEKTIYLSFLTYEKYKTTVIAHECDYKEDPDRHFVGSLTGTKSGRDKS